MPSDLKPSLVSPEALRRKHEAGAPRLHYAVIIAAGVVLLLLICVAGTGGLIHLLSRNRPLQSMAALGLIAAPDLKPLERFPLPHLEIDDGHAQMTALLAQQNQKLNSYGWIDRSNGIVHIPIDRAMDLLLERGLPVRTNGLSQTGVSTLRLIQERPNAP